MKLVVDQLQKRFGTQEVLRGASFTFEQGKIYGLKAARRAPQFSKR